MTVQLSDEQVSQLQAAQTALATVISRNRTRWVDIELLGIRAAIDGALRSQSEQTKGPMATSTGPSA